MSTEAIIIIQARRALINGSDIELQLPKYLKGIEFTFNDGSTAKNINEWFSLCKDRKIKDIRISLPLTVEQHPFEGTNETYDIICVWDNDQITRFIRSERREDREYVYTYKEAACSECIDDLPVPVDNTTEYKNVLSELMLFAQKIEYEAFNTFFDTAYKLLDGSLDMSTENIPYYLIDMPERLRNIMGATKSSYVFGGMGWWNDDPRGKAEMMGLKDEYNRLTNALIYNMRRALVYVTNTCFIK